MNAFRSLLLPLCQKQLVLVAEVEKENVFQASFLCELICCASDCSGDILP